MTDAETDAYVNGFVRLTAELSQVEKYGQSLALERAQLVLALLDSGLSPDEVSERYNRCGITVSGGRVRQLADRAIAQRKIAGRMRREV